MSAVISLAEAKAKREPHVSGEAFCIGCNHTWRGVWPLGTIDLECPSCKRKTGRGTFEVSPQEGSHVFQCPPIKKGGRIDLGKDQSAQRLEPAIQRLLPGYR